MRRSSKGSLAGLVLGLLLCALPSRASNPFANYVYAADPSAHVWNGRVYVYASGDRTDAQEYDMTETRCFSSDDLANWKDEGSVLKIADIPWASKHLWAPDCALINGVYCLYFPVHNKAGAPCIGVATSNSPTGPFKAQPQPIDGIQGIDPAVFVDDDGQAYIFWAGAGLQGAKLKSDGLSLASPAQKISGASEFFEGPWMFKREGRYYITYPALRPGGSGRGGSGQNYDYGISTSPLGPLTYKGTFSTSELGGNIHGSQLAWNGRWLCFYHDYSTSVGLKKAGFKRALRVDELRFAPNGDILPLEWTTSGPPKLKNLNPYERVEAECLGGADNPEGEHAITVEPCSAGGQDVGSLENGDWLRYSNVDFGAGPSTFEASLASPTAGAKLELRLDSLTGPIIGTCDIPATGGWQTWQSVKCPITLAKGVRDVYVRAIGPGTGGLFNFDWFRFTPREK